MHRGNRGAQCDSRHDKHFAVDDNALGGMGIQARRALVYRKKTTEGAQLAETTHRTAQLGAHYFVLQRIHRTNRFAGQKRHVQFQIVRLPVYRRGQVCKVRPTQRRDVFGQPRTITRVWRPTASPWNDRYIRYANHQGGIVVSQLRGENGSGADHHNFDAQGGA